ncbi:hypothetical protein C8J56DRAFT_880056 [Mycena floridula]|nr:hypothetical protein C8J56DRAFT_880056 [Mycena floridula]
MTSRTCDPSWAQKYIVGYLHALVQGPEFLKEYMKEVTEQWKIDHPTELGDAVQTQWLKPKVKPYIRAAEKGQDDEFFTAMMDKWWRENPLDAKLASYPVAAGFEKSFCQTMLYEELEHLANQELDRMLEPKMLQGDRINMGLEKALASMAEETKLGISRRARNLNALDRCIYPAPFNLDWTCEFLLKFQDASGESHEAMIVCIKDFVKHWWRKEPLGKVEGIHTRWIQPRVPGYLQLKDHDIQGTSDYVEQMVNDWFLEHSSDPGLEHHPLEQEFERLARRLLLADELEYLADQILYGTEVKDEIWLEMLRQGNENAFPFIKINTNQRKLLEVMIPRIVNLQADDDKEGMALHLEEFKQAWLQQFPIPVDLNQGPSFRPLSATDLADAREAYWKAILQVDRALQVDFRHQF